MKRILAITILFLITNTAHAQNLVNDFIGLGMSAELADYLSNILPAGGNNVWLKGRNAANTADINMLKIDATDDTVLNADTGDVIKLAVAGTTEVTIDNDLIAFTGAATNSLTSSTVDGADGAYTYVSSTSCATGDCTGRGGYAAYYGNEVGGVGGSVDQSLGGTTGNFRVVGGGGAIALLDIEDNGDTATFATTITSSRTTDIGWSVVAAANQACNTTCTSACVTGIDTLGTGGFLACTTATADFCLCAGAS